MRRRLTRKRVLLLCAILVGAIMAALIVAESLVRSRLESALAETPASQRADLTLGDGPALWSLATGEMSVEASLDSEQLATALKSANRVDIEDISISDKEIAMTLDMGDRANSGAQFLEDGQVIVKMTPGVSNGNLSFTLTGVLLGGVERGGPALSTMMEPIVAPSSMLGCGSRVDKAEVLGDALVLQLTTPTSGDTESCG